MRATSIFFLNKLKNCSERHYPFITSNYDNIILQLIKLLYSEGLIQGFKLINDKKIKVYLRYYDNTSPFSNLKIFNKRASNSISFKVLCQSMDKKNVIFLSTNKGIQSSLTCKKLCLGGKLLFRL